MDLNSFKISFERAIMQLIDLCNHAEHRKQWCVKICHDCQQLMKPWPASVLEEKKQRKSNDSPSLGKSVDQSGEHLTAIDREELKLVERALRKAGKTRQLFKTELNDCQNVVDLPVPVVDVDSSDAESVKTIQSSKLSLKDNPKRTGINPKDQKMVRLSDKTRSTGLRNVNSTRSQNFSVRSKGQQNVEEEKSSDVAVISQSALDFLHNSALSKSETSKAQSSVRHRPAHMNAPFLTLPQVKSTKTIQTHKSLGSGRSSSSSLHSKTRVQSVSASSKDHHHYNRNSNANHFNVDKMRSKTLHSVTNDCRSESPNATRPLLTEPQTDAVQQVLLSEKSFDENFNHEVCANVVAVECDADATKAQDTRFCLLRDGSSLKLPSELSKALSKNYQLHSKLESSNERRRRLRDGESSSQNFCDLLQRHIDDCNSDSFEQSLQYNRISDVLVWLKRLLDMVTSVDVSDESPAEVIVKAQKTIEYVTSEFSGLKDILRSLHLDERPNVSKGIDEIQVKWRHKRDIVMNWFSDDGPHGVKLIRSSRIEYENERQLLKYTTLGHRAQLLQLQSMVLEAVGSDAIALLNQLPSNDRLFPLLYQSFYSLLCSFGSSFPAIVKVIGDDED